MKKLLLSRKIGIGIVVMLLSSITLCLFISFGIGVDISVIGMTLANAPIVFKAEEIADSEKLAIALNNAFKTLSESTKATVIADINNTFKGKISDKELVDKFKEFGLELKTINGINTLIEKHGLELKKNKNQTGPISFKSTISTAFAEFDGLKSKLKELWDKDAGTVTIFDSSKAVGNLTTSSVSTDTGGNAILDLLNADEINDIRLRQPFIEDFATVTNTNKAVYTYADYLPKDGDFSFIGEGDEKPQLDLEVEIRSETPNKAAGYEILTEESVDDIPRMESNARTLLFKKYLLKRQNGILFGDGLGDNPTGVTAIASLFNPASWTGDKVKSPNMHDAIIAAANQIFTTFSYTDDVEYFPNVAFVNPGDFSALRLSKNENGNYLFPQFTIFNERVIDNMRVIPKNKIPAGYVLIGDFTKLNVINYIAYSVRIGWINDQFIKNLFTMLGEGRFYTFVKFLDQRAFLYDTIENIEAGIEEIVIP